MNTARFIKNATVMKATRALFLVVLSASAVAENSIAYVDVEQIYKSSKVINKAFAAEQKNYLKQTQVYAKQQLDLESQINGKLSQQNQLNFDQLSLKAKQLQESVAVLNSNKEQQLSTLKRSYIIYVRKAAQQIYKQQHYQYILSSSAVVASDESANISIAVSQLADKLYSHDMKK